MSDVHAGADREDRYSIRAFAWDDVTEVDRLARIGLLPGHIDHHIDATADDPHGSAAGRPTPQSFWVVEADGHVVGTIAMVRHDREVGQLLQLRVAPALKTDPRVPRMLVRAAAECARERGVLKIMIESPGLGVGSPVGGEFPITSYLRSLGFEFARTHLMNDRTMLEFYLDLYQRPEVNPGQTG